MKGLKVLLCLWFIPLISYTQTGGTYTYAFLNQTNSARVASLGGKSVALPDADLNMPFHNPSLLSAEMDNHLVLNYVGYFADIKYGYASYSRSYEKAGNFAVGLHYIDYGEFPYADIYGVRNGYFDASEYALNLIYSRKIDSFLTVGVNVKPIYTSFERYNSIGIAADLGITYYNPEKLFTAAFVLKNMGAQITTYYGGAEREKIPFEIQAGLSQKFAYAPFRFSFLFQHLQRWDLQYKSQLEEQNIFSTGEEVPTRSQKLEDFGDNLLRHMIMGMEFIPGENFYVSLGYNYLRRQEMKIRDIPGMVGFSWGFGLRVSKFHFSYGRASYHLAGGSNHFSVSTNLSEFYRKE